MLGEKWMRYKALLVGIILIFVGFIIIIITRLDLCKERYGGPFTTVQVEDVKSFLYILSIVVGTFGYEFIDTKLKISEPAGPFSFHNQSSIFFPSIKSESILLQIFCYFQLFYSHYESSIVIDALYISLLLSVFCVLIKKYRGELLR